MRSTAKSDVELMMCHPFGNLENSDNIYEKIYDPLNAALPDLERRDLIVLAGCTPEGEHWIGCMGNYILKASTGLMWIALIVYGVWHAAPFAFVIFYAGLQTLPEDQIEAAQIDGASRIQQVWYVVLPHLMPLVAFVALIQLMDNFRVFEPIIGFNASAHATSLSWFIFNDLGGETRQLSSASATSAKTSKDSMADIYFLAHKTLRASRTILVWLKSCTRLDCVLCSLPITTSHY